MKKSLIAMACVMAGLTVFMTGCEDEEDGDSTGGFYVYQDGGSSANHYATSGWMGDWGDISADESWAQSPYGGSSCIRVGYTAVGSQGNRWMGIYWQDPANNWGTIEGGYDLTGYTVLTFWARGENGGEVIDKFKIGGITGTHGDTAEVELGPVTLTQDWVRHEIDISGRDLSRIIGGFCLTANASQNPGGFVIYLDEIQYE